jgi:O-antigen biosynthesis protein
MPESISSALSLPVSHEDRLRACVAVSDSSRAGNSILVIDRSVPTSDRDSGSQRMFRLLRHLRARGWQVTFVPLNLDRRGPYSALLEDLGVDVDVLGPTPEDAIARIGPETAVVMISRPEPALRLLPAVRAYADGAALVYDTVDLHWLRYGRAVEVGAPEDGVDAKSMRAMELTVAAESDVVLAISPQEQHLLELELPGTKVAVVSNVHDPVEASAPFAAREGLVFVGGFLHGPNVDAMEWFIREIWPKVRATLPTLTMRIVGSDLPPSLKSGDGIEAKGWVPDVDEELRRARLFVAPLRYGAGLKGKIGAAFSAGVPVVTTGIGAEGFGIESGTHALVADGPQAFADAIASLYDDAESWHLLANAGRNLVASHCAPEIVGAALDEALREACERARRRRAHA